ncbi:uncharacterized protein TrAtP1_012505 [Trichoderma atroviride]|uniref:uncharacterized protein n=1 Tax=Hypocrea atroviridis TaxID=63577 RepID=UPI003330A78E|nr:hypothetical protein TrAtP1_012505 [Trichoderma atroviride]
MCDSAPKVSETATRPLHRHLCKYRYPKPRTGFVAAFWTLVAATRLLGYFSAPPALASGTSH